MSSVIIPPPADLLLSTCVRALPRLCEPTLHSRLDDLRAMVRSLLTELDSLGLPLELEPEGGLNLDDELKRYEIGLIRAALDKAGGSQTRAARMLGVKVTTLNTKIKRYQIMRCKS
jgi:transcriptional regulator with GAF, ATPase, and Fis domain